MKSTSRNYYVALSLLLCVALSYNDIAAVNLNLSFEEIAQTADLIFIGTVKNQECVESKTHPMIFTHVYFQEVEIIHQSPRSVQQNAMMIEIIYAGGQVNEKAISISGSPTFADGMRYLLFILDDGKIYMNPIVGGNQGIFQIIKDQSTGEAYLITPSGKTVVKSDAAGFTFSKGRVSHIEKGFAHLKDESFESNIFFSQAPTAIDNTSSAITKVRQEEGNPVSLKNFIQFITTEALVTPLREKRLKFDGQGSFIRRNGMKVEVQDLRLSTLDTEVDRLHSETFGVPLIDKFYSADVATGMSITNSTMGGTLGACGYHDLYLVMEQVDPSWWTYSINDNCMATWNAFMDIYRFTPDDGTYGDNSENEFCGFVSDADLNSVYGFHWGSGIAMCVNFTYPWPWPECGEILQSDVLWNSAYTWTNNHQTAINTGAILIRPVTMHELGHTWGYQCKIYTETYDYDHPSVMQGYTSDWVIEDGWGIHAVDAYLVRRQYEDQTSIIDINDVGVESYYASNGLINSTTNKTSYITGESIMINNFTVENMSYSDLSDVRIRFYLSTNRDITTSDYQMGGYWYWSTFTAEAYNTSDYTMNIPTTIPGGNYFVGAIVTINSFNSDDFPWNNSTYLFDDITVYVPPSADFVGNPIKGVPPLTVAFTDSSTGDITSRFWTFGDGGTSTATNPSHTYYVAGCYDVSLTASGPGGSDTETKVCYIFVNTPPVASNLKITPELCPKTTDDLVGSYDYFDADGDPEGNSQIRWYKDGLLQLAFNDILTVPSSATAKHQYWLFTVRPHDGKEYGALVYSDSVMICNTPPVASNLLITPAAPDCDDDLVLSYTYFDADGDPDSGTRIRWYRHGIHQPAFDDLLTVPGSATTCCDRWYATVEPGDGEEYGALQTASTVNVQMQLIVEAEAMQGRISYYNNSCPGGWRMTHPNHPLFEDVDFPQDFLFHFIVTAKAEIGHGIAPWLEVRIGDEFVGTVEVNSTIWQDYPFVAFITGGNHTLSLNYLNDWWLQSVGDRNLLIDNVEISCQFETPAANSFVFEAEDMGHQHPKNYEQSGNVVLHRPYSYVAHDVYLTKNNLMLEVVASAIPTDGVWPEMNIRFDDDVVQSLIVPSSSSMKYQMHFSTSTALAGISDGIHRVKIEYKHDSWASGRHILIDRMILYTDAGLLKSPDETPQAATPAVKLPDKFALKQNYPNPFNPDTDIDYELPVDCFVKIRIMNVLGQEIRALTDTHQSAGYHTIHWDGKDDRAQQVGSGVYFYSIDTGEFYSIRKMILLR